MVSLQNFYAKKTEKHNYTAECRLESQNLLLLVI